MKILSVEQIRALDKQASAQCHIPSLSLMQKAAEGVAHTVLEIVQKKNLPPLVGIVCGKGNNGGDGFATACVLSQHKIRAKVFCLFHEKTLSKDARYFYRKAKIRKEIEIIDCSTTPLLSKHTSSIAHCSVTVDAILGTGFEGEPQGIVADGIDAINRLSKIIVSVDVPSGLNAATGLAQKAVIADTTVTLGFCKTGFLHGQAMNYVGNLRVVDIGIPAYLTQNVSVPYQLVDRVMASSALHRKERISHKGTYGHVLIVGGSMGMSGAAILAGRSAGRTGSGLVTIACPNSIQSVVAHACPELMSIGLPETSDKTMSACAITKLKDALAQKKFDALVLGPGIGLNKDTQSFVLDVIREINLPMVIDADGLNAIANNRLTLKEAASENIVLTPHLGEMARLLGKDLELVKKHMWDNISTYSAYNGVIVVCKSHISSITDGVSGEYVNIAGNAGMATGGMGDVLAGIVGSLLGQGLKPLDAARTGAFIHGSAGDLAAEAKGFYGLIASDVIDCIPQAIADLPLQR